MGRRSVRIALLASIMACGAGCAAYVGIESTPAPGEEKVVVCHKGKTLEIGAPALEAHLKHGDTRGPCR